MHIKPGKNAKTKHIKTNYERKLHLMKRSCVRSMKGPRGQQSQEEEEEEERDDPLSLG